MTTTVNTDAPAYTVDGVLTDGEAWVALSTTVLTGDANSITWTSSTGANDWSQYMDLIVISYAHNDYSGASGMYTIIAEFNNDTTSANYITQRYYVGSSSITAQSVGSLLGAIVGGAISEGVGTNLFSSSMARIYDINSGKWKAATYWNAASTGDTNARLQGGVNVWNDQAAITEIDLTTGDNWTAGSRFDLFGVLPRMVS